MQTAIVVGETDELNASEAEMAASRTDNYS